MATTYRWDSQIPPHPEVPDETRHRLIEQMAVRELATLRKLHRAAAKNQKLQDQYRSQVEKLFGRARYRRFRDYVQKAHEDEAAKLRPKGRELPLEQKERLVKKRADAADAYLEKLGVSADALRALNESWAKRIVPESKPAED